ncbi:hypothetical protein FQA39_LY19347 [Lamprigera yunnana]|nr:hypothetical protein FQA39_LY19347 [Lamprigera yunnana]
MAWFRRNKKNIHINEEKEDVPKGLWYKSPKCITGGLKHGLENPGLYDINRWPGASAPNNPCPYGFSSTNSGQSKNPIWQMLLSKATTCNAVDRSVLKLPRPGYRIWAEPALPMQELSGYYIISYSGATGKTSNIGLTAPASIRVFKTNNHFRPIEPISGKVSKKIKTDLSSWVSLYELKLS